MYARWRVHTSTSSTFTWWCRTGTGHTHTLSSSASSSIWCVCVRSSETPPNEYGFVIWQIDMDLNCCSVHLCHAMRGCAIYQVSAHGLSTHTHTNRIPVAQNHKMFWKIDGKISHLNLFVRMMCALLVNCFLVAGNRIAQSLHTDTHSLPTLCVFQFIKSGISSISSSPAHSALTKSFKSLTGHWAMSIELETSPFHTMTNFTFNFLCRRFSVDNLCSAHFDADFCAGLCTDSVSVCAVIFWLSVVGHSSFQKYGRTFNPNLPIPIHLRPNERMRQAQPTSNNNNSFRRPTYFVFTGTFARISLHRRPPFAHSLALSLDAGCWAQITYTNHKSYLINKSKVAFLSECECECDCVHCALRFSTLPYSS